MTGAQVEHALASPLLRQALRAESGRRRRLEPFRLWRIAVINSGEDDVRRPLEPSKTVAIGFQPRPRLEDMVEDTLPPVLFGTSAVASDMAETAAGRLQDRIWERRVLRTVMDGWVLEHGVHGQRGRDGLVTLPEGLQVQEPGSFVPFRDFLRGEGFPVNSAPPAAPDIFTLEVSGIAVVTASGEPTVSRLPYFIQRTLVDDEGNVICLGLDEGLEEAPPLPSGPVEVNSREFPFPVYLAPCAAHLIARQFRKSSMRGLVGDASVIRYVFYPALGLPLIDTPLLGGLWTDVFIYADMTAAAFIPKPDADRTSRTLAGALEDLWARELKKEGHHLLKFTRNTDHVTEYLTAKTRLLRQAFDIVPFSLAGNG
jgi:hypothetical protein